MRSIHDKVNQTSNSEEHKSQEDLSDLSQDSQTQNENSYSMQGCHDVGSFSSKGDEEEEMVDSESSEYIKELHFKVQHLEWHCAIYRDTLSKVPGSTKLLQESKAKFLEDNKDEEQCQSCKIEDLQKKLEHMETQLYKKTLGQKWISNCQNANKKRK